MTLQIIRIDNDWIITSQFQDASDKCAQQNFCEDIPHDASFLMKTGKNKDFFEDGL